MRHTTPNNHGHSMGSHAGDARCATAVPTIRGCPPVRHAPPSLLHVGTNRALRRRLFVPDSWAHPAKLHLHLVQWLAERYTSPGETILDPMGGIGSTLLALLVQRDVVLYDVERRWLDLAVENARRIQRARRIYRTCDDSPP